MTLMYQSPLAARYSSSVLLALFSEQERAVVFRKLWLLLAEIEKDLGLPISEEAINQMKKALYSPNLERVKELEASLHHDVMAHIRAFGEACPKAAGIIHLGATSCYVTDNADVLIYKKALDHLMGQYKKVIEMLVLLCERYKHLPCVGYTHFQVAQPTTMGKRMSLWLQDLWNGYLKLQQAEKGLKLLGVKGATGSQSSFLVLFEGSIDKVNQLEAEFSSRLEMGTFAVSGQTYSRLQDSQLIHVMSEIGASFHKMATDIRLLSHTGELCEAFSKTQVGSSAMPHKKNPMLSERLCSLARFLMQQAVGTLNTQATQWLERSLDDSAIRRMVMPESFLSFDAMLSTALKILKGLNVNEARCEAIFEESLKAICLEPLLMKCSLHGKNRQSMHEELKQFFFEYTGPFEEFLKAVQAKFHIEESFINSLKDPSFYTAMCSQQVNRFIDQEIKPVLAG